MSEFQPPPIITHTTTTTASTPQPQPQPQPQRTSHARTRSSSSSTSTSTSTSTTSFVSAQSSHRHPSNNNNNSNNLPVHPATLFTDVTAAVGHSPYRGAANKAFHPAAAPLTGGVSPIGIERFHHHHHHHHLVGPASSPSAVGIAGLSLAGGAKHGGGRGEAVATNLLTTWNGAAATATTTTTTRGGVETDEESGATAVVTVGEVPPPLLGGGGAAAAGMFGDHLEGAGAGCGVVAGPRSLGGTSMHASMPSSVVGMEGVPLVSCSRGGGGDVGAEGWTPCGLVEGFRGGMRQPPSVG
ncbi:hypothetical protein HDU67_000329, partial [Dinochytrium kinnereticum]